jgi:hypothetical protein
VDAATAVAITVPITALVVAIGLVLRWAMSRGDAEIAATKGQITAQGIADQTARDRDTAIVAQKKAEAEIVDANASNAQLHDKIDELLKLNTDATKEKLKNATDEEALDLGRAAFGVPPRPSTAPSGGQGASATAGGGNQGSAAVPLPATPSKP